MGDGERGGEGDGVATSRRGIARTGDFGTDERRHGPRLIYIVHNYSSQKAAVDS